MDIQEVLRQYRDELLKLPNVTAVGLGERAGEKVIKVFVTHKVPQVELSAEDIVPKTLQGFRCDVEAIGVPSTEAQPR